MKLRRLQKDLEALYQVETELDIGDFLLDEQSLERLGEKASELASRGEVLFVLEEEGVLSVGLFLRDDLPPTLDDGAASLRYLATLEGVSHFVYLTYHARQNRPVRKLELELQAEVDKFATGVLGLGFREKAHPEALRRQIFDEASLAPELDAEEEERYLTASRLARRYSVYLERRFLRERHTSPLLEELRTFYRLELPEKITRIMGA